MDTVILRKNSIYQTKMEIYHPKEKKNDKTIIIFPGGGYSILSDYEGSGYAEFFNKHGFVACVVYYATINNDNAKFPQQLLDARASVRYLRANCVKLNINPDKIYVMGSSAGGHLAALLSTCTEKFENEEKEENYSENYLPNGQILCYPVVELYGKFTHKGSALNLFGSSCSKEKCKKYSPNLIAKRGTPHAFIWHTLDDACVPSQNSLNYAKKLRQIGTSCELHIFPFGVHGLGLCDRGQKHCEHVNSWKNLLLQWLYNY